MLATLPLLTLLALPPTQVVELSPAPRQAALFAGASDEAEAAALLRLGEARARWARALHAAALDRRAPAVRALADAIHAEFAAWLDAGDEAPGGATSPRVRAQASRLLEQVAAPALGERVRAGGVELSLAFAYLRGSEEGEARAATLAALASRGSGGVSALELVGDALAARGYRFADAALAAPLREGLAAVDTGQRGRRCALALALPEAAAAPLLEPQREAFLAWTAQLARPGTGVGPRPAGHARDPWSEWPAPCFALLARDAQGRSALGRWVASSAPREGRAGLAEAPTRAGAAFVVLATSAAPSAATRAAERYLLGLAEPGATRAAVAALRGLEGAVGAVALGAPRAREPLFALLRATDALRQGAHPELLLELLRERAPALTDEALDALDPRAGTQPNGAEAAAALGVPLTLVGLTAGVFAASSLEPARARLEQLARAGARGGALLALARAALERVDACEGAPSCLTPLLVEGPSLVAARAAFALGGARLAALPEASVVALLERLHVAPDRWLLAALLACDVPCAGPWARLLELEGALSRDGFDAALGTGLARHERRCNEGVRR